MSKLFLCEGIEDEFDSDWKLVNHKRVLDADGFYTDYAWYVDKNDDNRHVFVFGDMDMYSPEDGWLDWEADSYDTAKEWFDNYNGYDEDEDDIDFEEVDFDDDFEGVYDESCLKEEQDTSIDFENDGFVDEISIDPSNTIGGEGNDLETVNTEVEQSDESLGVSNLISSLIKDEYEAIEGYNGAISTLRSVGCENLEEFTKIFQDIIAEENKHIGQLQEMTKHISPLAVNIDVGEQEAHNEIYQQEAPSDDLTSTRPSLNDEVTITDIDDTF